MNRIISLFTLLFVCSCTLFASKFQLVHLKTDYSVTPLGIDTEKPRFSWQMQSEKGGTYQKAYQISVTDESGKEVWNSGKVKSDISLNIRYEGTPLKPTTRYRWHLSVWDEKNSLSSSESWFETGFLSSGLQAWNGAKWIGGGEDDLVLYSHYLPVFRIDYSLQLDEKTGSTRAGFIYGANDERLMNKNRNIYQLENRVNQSYLMVEVDIAPLEKKEEARLNIYRAGYHPDDKPDVPFRSYRVPLSLINSENRYTKLQIGFTTNLGDTRISVNGEQVASLGLNPLGQGGDFIAFPVVGEIGYFVPANQSAHFSDIAIRNFRTPSNLLAGINGETVTGGKEGHFTVFDPSRNSSPMLRTVFHAGQEIVKARLYVTSRGIYDFYLNGERVSENYFNPGMTQYNKTHMYQTFDVTASVQSGENAMGAILAEGWWSGGATYSGDAWNYFGDRQSLLAKLTITYADGSCKVIVTDPATWNYFGNGPVVYGSFFQGEVYDASKESQTEGWSTASYDDSAWKRAQEISLAGTTAFAEGDYANLKLTGQYDEGVKPIRELTAQSMEEVRPGVYVYDMGQNMAGIPKIDLKGMKKGQKINLRFAEVKYPDLPAYKGNTGMIMLENIRAAMAQDIYIARGGEETIQPRFTFHGYRFIEITGIERPLPLEAVKGIVISSVHELASSYKTSNNKVNRLWENIVWSTYANFLSIPTDCPQRNERMGWSGDISVFCRAATYLAEVPNFLRKHMLAMRDTQSTEGRFPDVAPLDVGFGGILWGSAGITVPWEIYLQYYDTELLNEHYEAMKRYMHYISERMIEKESGLIVQNRAWGDLGDWLSPEDGRNDKSLLWEAYYIYNLDIMQKTAAVLHKTDDADHFDRLRRERKDFFVKTYIQPESTKTRFSAFEIKKTGDPVDTQTSYVLPLALGLVDGETRKKLSDHLIETIVRENRSDQGITCPPYSLMTGFIGTAWINKALSDNGYSDVAYRLLQQTSYPSWLYPVEQGATTIWERLNSYTHLDGFGGNNRMNSFNHYSFGAVASWMYSHSLGIERDEKSPGFKHFFLKPEIDPTGEMTFAEGHYDSMYGRIKSSWKVKNGNCNYSFTVPANTSATLLLKGASADDIKSGKKSLKSLRNVKYLGEVNGMQTFELQPGEYDVQCRKP